MRTIIITGGAGFIGSNLAKRFVARGDKVYVLDNLSIGFEENIPRGAFFYKSDISDIKELRALKLPNTADAIYHLAAQSSGEVSFDDPLKDIDINYKGTYNLLKLAEIKKCKRFIYASSMSVYGELGADNYKVSEFYPCNPVSYYGSNKFASERLIQIFTKKAKLKPTIFRLFSVYGPGQNMLNTKQGIVSIYLSYLLKNKPILVKGSLNRFRDLTYIDDVLNVFISCLNDKRCYGEIFNLGTGVKTTVKELLSVILKLYGKKDFDKWVRVKGNTPGDTMGCIADIKKLNSITGWTPKHGLKRGIGKMKSWLDETAGHWLKVEDIER